MSQEEEFSNNVTLVCYSEDLVNQNGELLTQPTTSAEAFGTNNDNNVNKEENQLQQILNSILPLLPIEGKEYCFRQVEFLFVSSAVPTRKDVTRLQQDWNEMLQLRQARETGICAIRRKTIKTKHVAKREQLNNQALDELIRQLTIIMPEQGLLAVRIKNEANMTVDSYQTLYHSSIAYGMRKCINTEDETSICQNKVMQARQKKQTLVKQIETLQTKSTDQQRHFNELKRIDTKYQNDDIEYLKQQKQALESFLTEFTK
ncbi:hypothetical protein RFI_27756 [Reticulomyxa filosa]|uniref:Uncharacterized protein n=1 Tax=Reticulomyxa filosa TaxID=46433 RepID=X6M7H6_RETFI|nr:hypothetical protein RFI_27756 [Reticulomyxa filosa]|eukprot:ETO09616.1 hypothetical protein RFI_27756 [Reticulomyxa filosa]